MSQLVVRCFSISVDGFGAGPEQSLADPLGKGGTALHGWMFKTQTFLAMHGAGGRNKFASFRIGNHSRPLLRRLLKRQLPAGGIKVKSGQ